MRPNTRFLQNLLRGTESHNTALLAKEAAESQAKLQGLDEAGETKRRKYKPGAPEIRKRQIGDIKSILNSRSAKRGHPRPSPVSNESQASHINKDARRQVYERRRKQEKEQSKETHQDDGERRHRDKYRRRRLNSDDEDQRQGRTSHCSRSRSPVRHRTKYRDRSPPNDDGQHFSKHRIWRHDKEGRWESDASRSKRSQRSTSRSAKRSESDSESDMIGPARSPKTARVRGRGLRAASASSGIDRRFSASYDPKAENYIASGEEGWEEAKEAYSHLQKWKNEGAERLRKAGFSDSKVGKWEDGEDRRLEHVRWTKKGEKREWDRGKVVGLDGHVSLRADWA